MKLLDLVLAVAGGFIFGGLLGGYIGANVILDKWDTAILKQQAYEAKKAAQAQQVSHEEDTRAKEVEVRIKTVFKDRVVYRDREVPVEVRVREDAECVVPERFVRMWNGANQVELPAAAREPDPSPDRAEGLPASAGSEAL